MAKKKTVFMTLFGKSKKDVIKKFKHYIPKGNIAKVTRDKRKKSNFQGMAFNVHYEVSDLRKKYHKEFAKLRKEGKIPSGRLSSRKKR